MEKNKLKIIAMLFLSMQLISGCSSYQLKGPSASDERPGAMSMCMFYRSNDLSTYAYVMNFVEKNANNEFVQARFREADPGHNMFNRLDLGHYCFILTGLTPGVQYSFDYAQASYMSGMRETVVDMKFDPEVVNQTIPITVESGKIKFLGVYMFDAIVIEKGGFLKPEKRAIQIVDASNYSKEYPTGQVPLWVYGDYEKTRKGAEIHALKWLLATHKEGYWHDIAEKRLKELGL